MKQKGCRSALITDIGSRRLNRLGCAGLIAAVLLAQGVFQSAEALLLPPKPRSELLKSEQLVRVRLSERAFSSHLRGFDLEFYENSGEGLMTVARIDRQSEWRIDCARGQVLLRSLDGSKRLVVKGRLEVRTPAGFFRFRERPYREKLSVYASSDSTGCEVVNTVALEKYLDGLVNAEFSSRWSPEAVSAQVIAARTYALYRIEEAKSDGNSRFDVDATDKDQVYDGSMREDYKAARSVESTRGLVLMTENLSAAKLMPLKAFYHSTCGGMTTLPERVWSTNVPGFKKGVRCPFCKGSPAFSWKAHVDATELEADLKPLLPRDLRQGSTLGNLRIERKDSSGRNDLILTLWRRGSRWFTHTLSGAQFRTILGAKRIRSTQFDVQQDSVGRYVITGKGNGHGVGLCQWGAKVMGERGFNAASILSHYYPGAVLKKLW